MMDGTSLLRQPVADFSAAQSAWDTGARPDAISSDTSSTATSSFNRWWRIGDFGVFGLWVIVVGYTLGCHEKWADEAQAWLIARDLGLRTIWFHELRYEGSPGLWHTILWVAQHVFRASYGAVGYIGMAGAAAGVGLLIFKAPFPRIIRWPLAFTYFLVYQYAVIARSYTLLPLLTFAAAIFFKDVRRPERMTVVLVLLANLSVHGTVLAGCLGLAYLIQAGRSWRALDGHVQKRYQICVAVMLFAFLFLFIILKPTPDIEVFASKAEISQLSPDVRAQIFPSTLQKMAAVVSGAFLDYAAPSVLFVILAAAWCFMRGKFLAFALPVGGMLALYGFHGDLHHQGTTFVAAIAAIWIAWPTGAEQRAFAARERWATFGMTALLLMLCAVNIWDSVVVIQHDRVYAYSGGEDAARYLKSVGADHGPIFGFMYGMVAVQAYFDRNILANTPTAYFHHGVPFHGIDVELDELQRIRPDYLVFATRHPEVSSPQIVPQFAELGYEFVHFSDGYLLYKRTASDRETFFIFRRMRPAAGQTPSQLDPDKRE